MQIALQKILPAFFSGENVTRSDLWNKPVVFREQEHVHIIAPSGSGKTSLVHFLYGLRKDYSGEILYDKDNLRHFDATKMAAYRQHHISIVFQDLRLFTEQTVLQNLEIKRLLAPYHPESKIVEMAKRLGIESKLHKQTSTCSYGEQQRIVIIRALLQPFDFLLLDEPFSHLDEANRAKAMELIEEEAAVRKASIILADLKEIEYFKSERVIHV